MLSKAKSRAFRCDCSRHRLPGMGRLFDDPPPFCSNICTASAPRAPLRNYHLGPHHVKPRAAKSSQ